MKGGESGPAVVPSAPGESLLIQAVRYLDEPKMPPKQKLSEGEIAALERWVASGAPWPSSKAGTTTAGGFRADLRASRLVGVSTRPERAAPDGQRSGRGDRRNRCVPPGRVAIDEGSRPRSRRTGGPAPPRDVRPDRPAADARGGRRVRDGRFARRVREGRRSAARLARLRAAVGAALARRGPLRRLPRRQPEGPQRPVCEPLEAWRYRDWVVESFNRDLPFDQFIVHQIAGDLLPAPDGEELYADGLIATTFLVERRRGTAATPTRRRWSATWWTTRSTPSARRSWA